MQKKRINIAVKRTPEKSIHNSQRDAGYLLWKIDKSVPPEPQDASESSEEASYATERVSGKRFNFSEINTPRGAL
jgi:hypothetical protein